MKVAPLTGGEIADALPALARLRIAVFRDFPYLYDGTLDYEATYLARFAESRDAIIVAAWDGENIVGCATGSAMDTAHAEFAAPLKAAGIDPARTFYCGESVLLPAYRGRGVGHRFFDLREAQARAQGYSHSCFCAVVRPDDHPLKPVDYSPLDTFWRSRGYEKLADAIAWFGWTDLGETTSTKKPMQVWLRAL